MEVTWKGRMDDPLNSEIFYSDRKHAAGFVLAACKTTTLTASKEIASTIKTAKTNALTCMDVR